MDSGGETWKMLGLEYGDL